MYVATINVPGYLPMGDEPPIFETAQEAWEYLAEERRREEDYAATGEDDDYSDTLQDLERRVRWAESGLVCGFEAVGTVYGSTPGYDGDHDLGLAYSVTEIENPHEYGYYEEN